MNIVEEFTRGFNAQDVPRLLSCFTPDATYDDTFYGRYAGQEGLRLLFERMFRDGRGFAWVMD
jgi:hypothetical protein